MPSAVPFVVDHSSMVPTLHSGEVLLVDELATALSGYRRGDVVIFHPPVGSYDGPPLVKRVIGVGGDHVQIADGEVAVNGTTLVEPYLPQCDVTFPAVDVVVPVGHIFVLGDNRADSWDSRSYGVVSDRSIVGVVWLGT